MSQITAEERKLLADLKKLQDQLNAAGRTGTNAGNDVASSFGKVGEVVKGLIPVFGVAFAVDKIKEFSSYAFRTAMQFEQMAKTMAFVTGSTAKANEQFSYMTALAKNMGLNVQALTDGFKGFAASAAFAGVSQENINKQMVAFTKAASALSLSAEDTKLMFTALAQMYSKNKIQAEELRGQLGERLPGAMELLAKSMKVPVAALDGLLKKGEVITKEVMPAFAKEVEVAFGIAAANTETFTAATNRFFSSLETAVVRFMEGPVGKLVMFTINRLTAMADFFKWLYQTEIENQRDYYNARKVEVEKNVLFEIEAVRKMAKEKEGIELTVGEAANRILKERGEALKKYQKDIYEEGFKAAGQQYKGSPGLIGFIDDLKRFSNKAGTISKAAANTIFSPLEVASKGYSQVFAENMAISVGAFNRSVEAKAKLGRDYLNQLNYYASEEIRIQKEKDKEKEDEEGRAAKQRYQRELQMLELQERIRRLYAQSSIENEFQRSQALIKIGAEFNEKKKGVDNKYYKESFSNESQAMKDLRELTKNNMDLRTAENASFYADIRRNEDQYHKEAYEKEKKALEKLEKDRDKNADKQKKKRELTFDEEMALIDKKYQEMTDAAVQNASNIIGNEALTDEKRKELLERNYTLLNKIYEDKLIERNQFTEKYNEQTLKDFAKYFDELEKLRKQDFDNASRDLEALQRLQTTNMETQMLAEKNRLRGRNRPGDQQEMALLDKKQNEERVENEIRTLKERYELNRTFGDVESAERKNEQAQILADIKNLEEQKTAIQIDYAEQRKQYEIQVMKESFDLANQMVSGLMDLRSQQLDQQLAKMQENANEEIRLADGNKQEIMAINQRLKDEEKRIRKEQFAAQQTAAIADVVFRTAPIIAQYAAGLVTGPLALIAAAAAATQIGFILAQKAPEYAKGTQGKAHKGGPAIVGEVGVEKVITESGKVYYTPPTATLLDLPKGSHVIPNHLLNKEEIYYASNASKSYQKQAPNRMESQLAEIGSILKGLPIHQINMNERGFEKFVRTEKRSTKILNNSFPSKS